MALLLRLINNWSILMDLARTSSNSFCFCFCRCFFSLGHAPCIYEIHIYISVTQCLCNSVSVCVGNKKFLLSAAASIKLSCCSKWKVFFINVWQQINNTTRNRSNNSSGSSSRFTVGLSGRFPFELRKHFISMRWACLLDLAIAYFGQQSTFFDQKLKHSYTQTVKHPNTTQQEQHTWMPAYFSGILGRENENECF